MHYVFGGDNGPLKERERDGSPFVATIMDVSPEVLQLLQLKPTMPARALLLCPPGATHRLGATSVTTPSWLTVLEGAIQVALVAPDQAAQALGDTGQSPLDAFSLDLMAFPAARQLRWSVSTVQRGEELLLPPGWLYAWRALVPSLLWGDVHGRAATGPQRTGSTLLGSREAPMVAAEAARRRGNTAALGGRMREATEAYSTALDELDKLEVLPAGASQLRLICLANRAAMWLKRRDWAAATADCNAVLAGSPSAQLAAKSLFRRAKAAEGCGDADAAIADLRAAAELAPDAADVAAELEAYGSVLHRIVVLSNGDAETRRRQKGL